MTWAGGIILPRVDFVTPTVVEAPTINEVATPAADRQLTVAAEHSFIRTVYGEDRIGAQIANVAVLGGDWVIQCIWCEGLIDSINDLRFNDAELPAGISVTHYLGASVQTVDGTLAAAISGYGDALHGIVYTVLRVPSSVLDGFPSISARIKGVKVYDPRSGETAWSDNPALILRDFIVRANGRSVTDASVIEVANACDALVSGVKRRTLGLTLDAAQEVEQWIDTLRAYTSCWVVTDSSGILRLVPDRPRTIDATLTHADGQIKSISLKKRGLRGVPTVVRIRYTDTSEIPWKDAWQEADTGATPRRESEVALPGIHSAAAAKREAIERLNKLNLCDLSGTVDIFDAGLALEVGDVVAISHPVGLDAKAMRITNLAGDYGRYKLALAEYDASVYSDAVASEPGSPDTTRPSPLNPSAPTGLICAEEVYQLADGSFASRIRATWSPPDAYYLYSYRFEVLDSSTLIYVTNGWDTVARSPSIEEGITYTVRVATVSSLGAVSAFASSSVLTRGKQLLPSNVPSLSGFEVGGEVRLTIGAATDLDMVGYEVRYGAVGVSWANAAFCDFINAASGVGGYCIYKDAPAGTFDFLVCARDSIGQYSASAARKTITVTLDVNAFLIGNHDYTNPSLTGMAEYSLPGDATRYFITEDGTTAASRFPAAASTYGAIAASYHAAGTSQLTTEAWDVTVTVAGNWNGTISSTAVTGSKTDSILLSTGGVYTDHGSLTAKASGRLAKLQSISSGTSTLKVALPTVRLRLDAIPRVETGSVTTSASTYTRVTLGNSYTAAKTITLTPQGTTGRQAVVDNVVLNPTGTCTFDIYLFSSAGTQIAGTVLWSFEGV